MLCQKGSVFSFSSLRKENFCSKGEVRKIQIQCKSYDKVSFDGAKKLCPNKIGLNQNLIDLSNIVFQTKGSWKKQNMQIKCQEFSNIVFQQKARERLPAR